MSLKDEYSAIDIIYKLYEKIEALEAEVKYLSKKLDNLSYENPDKSDIQRINPTVKTDNLPQVYEQDSFAPVKQPEKLLLGAVKLWGAIKSKGAVPVPEVTINLYDSQNILVKSSKSDLSGYWEYRIPAGKYKIEYIHPKYVPGKKEIIIPPNVKEFEVK